MAHVKTNKKRRKALKRALRKGGDVSLGRVTMHADPFQTETRTDPEDGTAVIHPVTPEMMDEAAHQAARLADDMAHHGTAGAETAAVPSNDTFAAMAHAPSEVTVAALQVDEVAREQVDQVSRETVQEIPAQPSEPVMERSDAPETAPEEMSRAAPEPATEEACRDVGTEADAGGSETADPFGRYNATVVEMVRANMAATAELFAALLQARSVPEAVAINADHLHRQFDSLTLQGRELAAMAKNLTYDALKPFGRGIGRDG